MTETNCPGQEPSNVTTERARESLEQAESGDTASASKFEERRKSKPADVEAVEQEASDGPEGLGLAR